MTCETWDVVVVPFPFTDLPVSKRRPALVLSSREFNRGSGHSLMAQITTAKQSSWPGDLRIQNAEAGLPQECIVRMKLFTIDNRLIQRRAGHLSSTDQEQVRAGLRQIVDYRGNEIDRYAVE